MVGDWQLWLADAIVAAIIVLGVLARLGIYRRWVSQYLNPDLPFYARNGIFAVIPSGLGLLTIHLSLILLDTEGWETLGLWSSVALALLVITSVAIAYRPPAWSKPAWLREEEELLRLGHRSAYLEAGAEGAGYTTRWQLFLAGVGVAMAVGGVLFFDWGSGALVGLSMTLPMLRAYQLRDKKKPPYIMRRRRRPGD